ncbi:immunoglobulin lambda-like polypeptide 1-like protein [Pitangus sulphuratus]|nr:immunoglobulin lambda-like polypeptide 1-like protein [Pitangus sulphuratus]
MAFGRGSKLVVPGYSYEITPSPSAYRLTSKDDEGLEMCLITDYSPENVNFYSTEKATSAVVEVATAEDSMESSYLSTYWARREEMQCGASHLGFGELEGEDPESGSSTVCVTGLSLHFKTELLLDQKAQTGNFPKGPTGFKHQAGSPGVIVAFQIQADEHLNTLSLSQLGLKIILMKGLIFNVVMTMLLWKKEEPTYGLHEEQSLKVLRDLLKLILMWE